MTAERGRFTETGSRPVPRWHSFPPFYAHLGLTLDALADGVCVVRLPHQDQFGNSRGEVHGGAVAALLDITLSQAVRSAHAADTSVATISLTVNYLSPAKGELICRGQVVRRGRTVAFAEGEVSDVEGKPVCRASGAYRLMGAK